MQPDGMGIQRHHGYSEGAGVIVFPVEGHSNWGQGSVEFDVANLDTVKIVDINVQSLDYF